MKIIAVLLFLFSAVASASPIVIDMTADGEAITIRKAGVKVASVGIRTTPLGKVQLMVNGADGAGTSVPALTIGGDRLPADVQVSPEPVFKPLVHLTARATIAQGSYGDVWFDGTLVLAPWQVMFDNAGNRMLPVDPRGALVMGRTRYPQPNEHLGMIRMFRRDVTGLTRENARVGLSEHGFLYFNDGANDAPRISFRFDNGSTKMRFLRTTDGLNGEMSYDNSGALKYESPAGTVTTTGAP